MALVPLVPGTLARPGKLGSPGLLGIDVGGTKVALRVEGHSHAAAEAAEIAEAGEPDGGSFVLESSFRWPSSGGVSDDLAVLADNLDALRATWAGPIGAVGVAMPATLDADGRVVTWPGRPSWAGLELASKLREWFGEVPVTCADDGDLAALAEADHAGCADLVYLGVGTGIGGGVVLAGRSCPGPARGSCEVGHVIVQADGPPCDCGRRGCVQALAAGPATLRRAAERRGAPTTFDELRDAWADGADWAVRSVRDSAAALAVALIGLTELFHPDLAVVGGGFASGLPGFVDDVAERAHALARPGHPPAPVREAALGGLSSLYGAVLLARDSAAGR